MPKPHSDKHIHAVIKNSEYGTSFVHAGSVDHRHHDYSSVGIIYIMTDGNCSKHDSKTILLLAIPKTNTDFNI